MHEDDNPGSHFCLTLVNAASTSRSAGAVTRESIVEFLKKGIRRGFLINEAGTETAFGPGSADTSCA